MGRGWEVIALLREGRLPIKNFGVAFCGKRPHIFVPEVVKSGFHIRVPDFR
jgi:hypothetical protein